MAAVASLAIDEERHLMLHIFMHDVKSPCDDSSFMRAQSRDKKRKNHRKIQ